MTTKGKNNKIQKSVGTKQQNWTYTNDTGLLVRLRGKLISGGKISLYLDYYTGYSRNTADDKIKIRRQFEYLKLYLYESPKPGDETKENNKTLKIAREIRIKRESEIKYFDTGLTPSHIKNSNFFDFCQAYLDKYQKKDKRMIQAVIEKFKQFSKTEFLKPGDITKSSIKEFADFLAANHKGQGAHSYLARFKKILNHATEKGYFKKSPADGIKLPTFDRVVSKEILTIEEIIRLNNTDIANPEIKRAFMFSINTGLRFIDVQDLRFKHIKNGKIQKNQSKTGREVTIDLNDNAIDLIGEIGKPDDKIFILPSLTGCLKSIKKWTADAGISKNITWHSARHSFATILLINRTDIKTVSSLLGHSKLEHTQKYLHVVDELKKVAVNTLPRLS